MLTSKSRFVAIPMKNQYKSMKFFSLRDARRPQGNFLLTRKFFIDYRYFWLIELLYVFGAKYQETEITVHSQFRKFHTDGWVDETKSERREKRKKDCCHRGNSNDMFSKNSDRNRLIHLGMDDAYGKHGLCPAFRFSDLFLELMFIEKALQASNKWGV